ncbi:hypothetical protein SCACP_38610 [Sporomusa carbonis]
MIGGFALTLTPEPVTPFAIGKWRGVMKELMYGEKAKKGARGNFYI